MNYKKALLTIVFVFALTVSFAQANILNAKSPDEIGVKTQAQIELDNDRPLEYGYVDDRDILYKKIIWEKIVLDERVNFPLYYPIDTNNIGRDRRSLYDVLINSIKRGDIKHVYDDSYFNAKRTLKDVEASLVRIDTSDFGYEQFNAGETISPEFITKTKVDAAYVSEYRIKGIYYFDKRLGELKYRLLGLAPVVADVNTLNDDKPDQIELFWIFFPDARNVLHKAKTFNGKNSAVPISFDHLLNSRRFSATVYAEENTQGDRKIFQYINENALMQLLESDRIKEQIRNYEQDMWSY